MIERIETRGRTASATRLLHLAVIAALGVATPLHGQAQEVGPDGSVEGRPGWEAAPEDEGSEGDAEEFGRDLSRIFGGTSDPDDEEASDDVAEDEPKLSPEQQLEQAYRDLWSEEEAIWRAAQQKIAKAWSRSGSASMDLLLERGRSAMQREDWAAAEEHLTDLVNLAPNFAEGWNVRASAHFHQEKLGAALADLANTIALEPRHYSAYAGLGVIFEQLNDEQRALAAHRAALEIHPHLENSQNAVRRLAPSADGRPI